MTGRSHQISPVSSHSAPGTVASLTLLDWSTMTTYLDHAATTPMRAEAIEALVAALGETGNASSLHGPGRAARRALEEAREQLAAALGARPSEVVWTAGGTEADNLAIKGLFWARRAHDLARRRILVSAVEHHAVLDPAFWLAEHAGAQVVLLDVDAHGRLDVAALHAELEAHAHLVQSGQLRDVGREVGEQALSSSAAGSAGDLHAVHDDRHLPAVRARQARGHAQPQVGDRKSVV